MDTSLKYHQKSNYEYEKRVTLPIFLVIVYIVCTFFPLIYTFFPFLGTIKIVLLVGIFLVISYFFSRDRYHNLTVYKHPIFFAWMGFLFFMLLGLWPSGDRGRTLLIIKVCYKYFLVFMIMIKIIDTPKRLDLIMGVFTLCGVGMAFRTVLAGIKIAGRTMAIKGGIFGDPNDLSLLLVCTLAFLLYFYLKGGKKLITMVSMIIVITAIVLTYSRGGLVGLCAVGFSFALFIARKSKRYIFFILAGIILIWSFAPGPYKKRMHTIISWSIDEETGLTGTRMDTWIPALKWGLEHPVTGHGAGMSLYFYGLERRDWHVVHNSFVQVFAEIGVIGFFCYLLLFIIPFKQYRALIKQKVSLSNEDLLRMRVILISIFSFSAPAFFLPQAYSPTLYLLTGFFLIQTELISKSIVKPNVNK